MFTEAMLWIALVPAIVIIMVVSLLTASRSKKKKQAQERYYQEYGLQGEAAEAESADKLPYRPKKILTKAEYSFYLAMETYVRKDVAILPKVGLKEFLYIPSGTPKFGKHWARISQKHVDFLLCDKTSLYIYCAVELDDKTHLYPDREERDRFVDEAVRSTGLALIHLPCKFVYDANDFKPLNEIVEYKKQQRRPSLSYNA